MATKGQSPIIVKYEKIVQDDPRSRAFAPLAEAYRKVGLIDKSFEVLKKGLRYNPDYLMGYLTLAQCYFDKNEFSLAFTTLRPLVGAHRDNLKLQRTFADCAYKTQNYEEALDTYKYILFINPRDEYVSEKVKELEDQLSEIVISENKSEVWFEVDELRPNPEEDMSEDDWVQYDLLNDSSQNDDSDDDYQISDLTQKSDREVNYGFSAEEDSSTSLSIEHNPEEPQVDYEELVEKTESEIRETTPVITHTLVDLYLQQGHKNKAIEVLDKILEHTPDDEASLVKLKQLKKQDQEVDDIQQERTSRDEGRSNLMAAFDETIDTDMRQDDLDEKVELEVTQVLEDFLYFLRTKSGNVLNS